MKRLFRSAFAAAALSAALSAAMIAAQPASAQTPPNVLVVGQIAEPKSLDPHTVTATNDFRILVNVYDGLVRFKDGTLEIEPALAESWDISEDGKTYTFTLRQGVKFHDGSDFTAEAVKFNFDRMLKEDHPFYNTGPFPLSFNFASVEAVNVIDSQTVEFKLSEAFAPFLSNLAYPTGLIVSPAAVEQHSADYGRNPSGTGPFKFAEWLSNQRVVVERNADYWGEAPALEAVVFRPVTDANTRVAEMLSGG
ncbi:MAG: ABC transporter substrate-binding protein, partial [Pseudorhizobium sp.]